MNRKPLNKLGRRGKRNKRGDAKNKAILEFIDWCELCGSHFNLQRAHRLKKSKIPLSDEVEYAQIAILCGGCHKSLDEYTGDEDAHERMYRIITEIIEKRKIQEYVSITSPKKT